MRKPIELGEIRTNDFLAVDGYDFPKRLHSKEGIRLWYIGDGLALIERQGHRDQVLVLGPSVILIPKGDTSPGDWTGDEPEAPKPEPAPPVIAEAPPKPKTGPKTRPRAKHKSK